MSVEYRWMRDGEAEAMLDVWVAANPGSDRDQWRREQLGLPGARARTAVAVGPDGSVLSAALYWPCQRRDARRRGHAGRLLDLLVEAMDRDGRAWSLLFADEAVQSLYERRGWPRPTRYRQGALPAGRHAVDRGYVVRPFDPWAEPRGWERLAGPLGRGVEHRLMLRGIAPTARVDALFAEDLPGAVSWLLDEI